MLSFKTLNTLLLVLCAIVCAGAAPTQHVAGVAEQTHGLVKPNLLPMQPAGFVEVKKRDNVKRAGVCPEGTTCPSQSKVTLKQYTYRRNHGTTHRGRPQHSPSLRARGHGGPQHGPSASAKPCTDGNGGYGGDVPDRGHEHNHGQQYGAGRQGGYGGNGHW